MKKQLILMKLLILLTCNITLGQYILSDKESFSAIAGFMQEEVIQKELVNGIEYEIYLKNGNSLIPKIGYKTGTCFFVYKDYDSYLVTAEHVAINCSLNTSIVVNTPENNPIIYKLKTIVEDTTKLDWNIHSTADVAVILLDSVKTQKNIPGIPFDMISSELKAPKRETLLTVFGFPLSLGVGKKISAISKTSQPSSGLIELPRFDNGKLNNFYLLDDPSVSGFSGGPVITLLPEIGGAKFNLNNNPDINKIIGLVHGSISDNRGSGGFAAIVPSHYIAETIYSADGYSGTHRYRYENGKLWSEVIFKNGEPFTVISNFKQSGDPQEKGTLLNGYGTRYIYDEDGKLSSIIHYENGRIVETDDRK